MSNELSAAKAPFRFYTRYHITEATGIKAKNLSELLDALRNVAGSSIYHHTHRFLQQHQSLSPEPPNDFAYWIEKKIGETELAEQIASIDIVRCSSIRAIREEIILLIEHYLEKEKAVAERCVKGNSEFYFLKSISFIFPTQYEANNLKEFYEILTKVTVNSIYFHIFESRMRLERKSNDFSLWFEDSLQDKELAYKIDKLDPYTYAIEDLRKTILRHILIRI